MLLTALEQFDYQVLHVQNRLLLAALEEPEDSGTTQKRDIKKTPAKMLPSILSEYGMCTIPIFVCNEHCKFLKKN